ncbi:SRPBCC family protein [Nocardiopsis sp. MG754419]|uniref:SRPBCC family protein n=1 Tax=Nocardiopsis sp. MG754419 TaxID=2259865 RepID=UPI001BA7A5DB|nr:SRPBCC family protein [Nocardiopsis sp. MG754419]MBR8742888.1 polyketide cyclase [Nocardiopsis sp. MG754419]
MGEHTSLDVDRQVGAVTRGLETRDGEGRRTLVSVISQRYDTGVADLWEACTSTERLPRWFAPVSGDLRAGGTYQVEGNASGTIESCSPPRSFQATWEYGGDVSWIAVRVDPDGDGARLTLEHTADAEKVEAFWERFGPGATGVGWDLAFLGLATYLSVGTDAPVEADGWETTEQGRRFITASSAAWAEAGIVSGTPRAQAEAARDRTTAFFLGEGPGAE